MRDLFASLKTTQKSGRMFRNFDGHREKGIGSEKGVDWLMFILWMLILTVAFSAFFMAEASVDILDVLEEIFE